jgi:hypothetical protein
MRLWAPVLGPSARPRCACGSLKLEMPMDSNSIVLYKLSTNDILVRKVLYPTCKIVVSNCRYRPRTTPLTLHVLADFRTRSVSYTVKEGGCGAAYISLGFRSSSLSSGWSTGVSMSITRREGRLHRNDCRRYAPRSNDCLAIPREASLPAKFPYIPSSWSYFYELSRNTTRSADVLGP